MECAVEKDVEAHFGGSRIKILETNYYDTDMDEDLKEFNYEKKRNDKRRQSYKIIFARINICCVNRL